MTGRPLGMLRKSVMNKIGYEQFNKKTQKNEYNTRLDEECEVIKLPLYFGYCHDCELTHKRNEKPNSKKTCVSCGKPLEPIYVRKK